MTLTFRKRKVDPFMKKKSLFLLLLLTLTVIFASCGQVDVVANKSVDSFEAVLDSMPDQIGDDEYNGVWTLTAPDQSVRFYWSKDFGKSNMYDVMLEIDATPFLEAGLELEKLPKEVVYEGKIRVGTDLSSKPLAEDGAATPLASYKKILELKREAIGYHAALDHYGIDLSGGHVFEWAKSLDTNDKDIVFVLNPQIFIDAGADPEKIEGWLFAKVETMDKDGKKIEVDKLLKPFNLK